MPYKHTELKIPRNIDKRVKLTYEQREEIRQNKLGLSQRALAMEYNVSRRTIQFILDPSKLEENLKRRAERGGSSKYYDKELHKGYMKTYRQRKQKLMLKGELI